MNTKSFRFFVFFIIIIFATAIIYFGIALYNTISTNSSILEDNFNSLTGKISSITKEAEPSTNTFSTRLENVLAAEPYVSCITLSDNSSVFFAWPADSAHLAVSNDGKIEIVKDSQILRLFNAKIQTYANNAITVNAALNPVTKAELYVICSRAFIIILAGTVFDFLLLIYLALFSQKKSGKESDSSSEMKKTLDDIEEEINTIAGKKETAEKKAAPEKTVNQTSKKEEASDRRNDSSDPAGLFSEKSGFGWESYLEPRLDAELIRAASNEMDLALFIIKIKGIERNISISQAVCQILLKFFKYKDMIFEYGESGYAGLLVNTDIDGAMVASESLYTELKEVFTKNDVNPEFGIGLTTRSLRLMTGARFLTEASKAADKATEEKTLPIVAFRVNHEKSKQYLAEEVEKIH